MTHEPDDYLEDFEIRPLASPACEMQFFEKELFGIDPIAEKNQSDSDDSQDNDSAKPVNLESGEKPISTPVKDN